MLATHVTDPYGFLENGGEIGALIRQFDWSRTPLGPIETWPQSLRTTTALALSSPLPVMMLWGRDGTLIYNDGYAAFAGKRHPALLGAKVLEGWPEAAELNARVLDTVLAGGTLSLREQRLALNRHGVPEDCWLDLDYMPILGEDGSPAGVFAVVVDITPRKAAEEALRASEARWRNLFEQMQEGFFIAEAVRNAAGTMVDFRFVEMNPAFEARTDVRMADAIGRNVSEIIPNLPPELITTYAIVLETGKPARYEINVPSMKHRWFEARARRIGPDRFSVLFLDITGRKKAEAALRESEARFRTLSQSMPNHVWTARPDGQLDWFNERIYAFTGAAPGTLDGEAWMAMIHPEDAASAAAAWENARRDGIPYETEFRLRRQDGTFRWHIARAVPAHDERGAITRWVGTNTDIDGQKTAEAALADLADTLEERVAARTAELAKAEEALRHSQKMEAIGNLTGGIAHDFNNLLQVIGGNLQLLSREVAGDEKAEKRVDNAMAGVARGSKLAAQLLAFGRRQPLEPKVVNVGRLIRDMDDLLRRTLGDAIEIESIVAGGLWHTLVDPANVENAILNLAINSRDAMDGQGRLTIEAGNASSTTPIAAHIAMSLQGNMSRSASPTPARA